LLQCRQYLLIQSFDADFEMGGRHISEI